MTAITKVKTLIYGGASLGDIVKELPLLLEEEKTSIADAWMAGNREGWAQSTDWPEDAVKYYERVFEGYRSFVILFHRIDSPEEVDFWGTGWGRNFNEAVEEWIRSTKGETKVRRLKPDDFPSVTAWKERKGNYGLRGLILVPSTDTNA